MNQIEQVLVALRRVIRATDLHSKYLAKTTSLTAPQMLLLQILRDNNQLTVGQLAQEMSLSQATVTTILDRLEKRELVVRQRSQTDKRKVFVSATAAAKILLEAAPAPLQDRFSREFHQLQDWEQTMIVSALQRLATMMDAQELPMTVVADMDYLAIAPDQYIEPPLETEKTKQNATE